MLGGEGRCDDLRAAETPGSPCVRAFAPPRAASQGRLHLREGEGMCVSCRSLRALAVISILVAACGGQPGAASAPRPGTASPAAPVSRASAPGAARVAAYQARTSAIPASMRRRMTGVSWRPGCPVGVGKLRLLRLSYWGFDHAVHQGQLIVNESAAKALTRVFGLLFAGRYPIQQLRVIDVFGGSDERSMLADNTSAFHSRRVRGTTPWSEP